MTLPYDYARCTSRIVTQKIPGQTTAITISRGQAECARCLRRTSPGHPTRQVYMYPPPQVDGKCPKRIGPEEWE